MLSPLFQDRARPEIKCVEPEPIENKEMERETRIELATNSLEGCDSTIELLPLIN
jgi:hypothetical protein